MRVEAGSGSPWNRPKGRAILFFFTAPFSRHFTSPFSRHQASLVEVSEDDLLNAVSADQLQAAQAPEVITVAPVAPPGDETALQTPAGVSVEQVSGADAVSEGRHVKWAQLTFDGARGTRGCVICSVSVKWLSLKTTLPKDA